MVNLSKTVKLPTENKNKQNDKENNKNGRILCSKEEAKHQHVTKDQQRNRFECRVFNHRDRIFSEVRKFVFSQEKYEKLYMKRNWNAKKLQISMRSLHGHSSPLG